MVFPPDLAVSAIGMSAHDSSYILLPVVLAPRLRLADLRAAADRIGPKPIVLGALLTLAAGAVSQARCRRPTRC